MKHIDLIQRLSIFALAVIFAGCKGPTPNSGIGTGTSTDDELNGSGAVVEGDIDGNGIAGQHPEARIAAGPGDIDWNTDWSPIHFGYDSATVASEDRKTLETIADWMKSNSGSKIMIAGHSDERGTLEYNRTLGQRRASAAREYLVKLGVSANNVATVSYGEEQPADSGHSEDAWTKNRRDEFGKIK